MDFEKLSTFFSEELFIANLNGISRDEIFKEMTKALEDNGKIKNHKLVLETIKKRETLGSTAIGKKVAIPHCRSLAVSSVHIVVGISRQGIIYDANKKRVNLIFLIVAPPKEKSNVYLPILGKIVEMIKDNKIRRSLMKAEDFQSFIEVIQGG